MKELKTYDIYYDEEGDFLEITFGDAAENEGTEQVEPGIFITKNTDTDQIRAVGILSFKKRPDLLRSVLNKMNISFPLSISSI